MAPLQKTPPQLRTSVREEFLGCSVLRFSTTNKGMKYHRLPLSPPPSSSSSSSSFLPSGRHHTTFHPALPWNSREDHYAQYPTLDLYLLRTCHAVYAECIPVLWTSNTIAMSSPLVLLYLHDYILPASHFQQIRHLQFEWTYVEDPEFTIRRYLADYDSETWERFWGLVAGMGLVRLGANVEYLGPPNWTGGLRRSG